MGGFITDVIAGFMENPAERDRNEMERVANIHKNAQDLKKQWKEPNRGVEAWRAPKKFSVFQRDLISGGSDGKQTKYLATPTSRANSYDSVLDIYTKLDIDIHNRKN